MHSYYQIYTIFCDKLTEITKLRGIVVDKDSHIIATPNWLRSQLSSPPSACVSPSDPTLTVENVTEVMGEVGDWERVADVFGLGVPQSKQQEIKQLSTSEREKSHSLGRYWVTTAPGACWDRLGRALYEEEEETALAMVKQYLPKGMYIS